MTTVRGEIWPREVKIVAGLGLLLLALGPKSSSAEKTDRVSLVDGTDMIGEVKSLEFGELTVSTDYMRTVQVDWDQVLRVESKMIFELETWDGTRFFGKLAQSDEDRVLVVEGEHDTVRVAFQEVLAFNQTKLTKLGKIWGSASLGLSFTQATDSLQVSFDGSINQRTRRFFDTTRLIAILSDTKDERFTRGDLSYTKLRRLPGRWTWEGSGSWQTNEQIGLRQRILVRGSAQYRTVRTEIRELDLGAGIAISREQYSADVPGDNSLEGTLSIRYRAFHFDHPQLQVATALMVFPSFTVSGRVRAELTADVRRELIEDFFWNLSLYGSYDSSPVGLLAENSDIALTASLLYKY